MKKVCRICSIWTAFFTVISYARTVRAADTVETFGVGATDAEFYLGLDGIGLDENETTFFSDILFGYGLIDRFSAYLGCTLEGTERFSNSAAFINMGLFGTPLETVHVDLDLFLGVVGGGNGFSVFRLTPAMELNLDHDPEMRTYGFYLHAGVPIWGQDRSRVDIEATGYDIVFDIETVVGFYYNVADGHQILIEHDLVFHPALSGSDSIAEIGGVAFGYNVGLHVAIEMINRVYIDVPGDGESVSVGVMSGIIVTLPSIRNGG